MKSLSEQQALQLLENAHLISTLTHTVRDNFEDYVYNVRVHRIADGTIVLVASSGDDKEYVHLKTAEETFRVFTLFNHEKNEEHACQNDFLSYSEC